MAASSPSDHSRRSLTTRRRIRWAVPAGACVAVAAGVVAPHAFAASAHPSLPAKQPAALIAAVASERVEAFSGTLQTTPSLGLPQLPGSDGGNQLTTLLTEPSSWQLWVDGADRQRVALLGTGKETDVVRDGADVWTWDSATLAATHYRYAGSGSSDAPSGDRGSASTDATDLSPQRLAQHLLAGMTPSTAVTSGPTTRIAGRPAYTLVLAPRTSRTLVSRAVIDVDAATGLPLGVDLYGRGSTSPSFSDRFTSLTLATPAASEFAFTPPAGATVTTHSVSPPSRGRATPSAGSTETTAPTLIGKGWAAVVSVPGSPTTAHLFAQGPQGGDRSTGALLQDATNPSAEGRELQTRLLSVLVTPSGRVLVGAVPVSRLEGIARQSTGS